MKVVLLARHGQAEANARGLLAGSRTNSGLTELGEQQAHELATSLKGREIDLLVSSPLSRASRTAEIVARDIGYPGEILTNSLFIERDFGAATDMPTHEAFVMLDNGTAEGAEAISDFGERAAQALEWLKARPENKILVISHSAFAQMIGTVARGGRPEDFLQFDELSNGGVAELMVG